MANPGEDSKSEVDGVARRRLLTVAVQYPDDDVDFNSAIRDQLEVLASWWCDPGLGERRFVPEHAENLARRHDVEEFLNATQLRESPDSDAIVLFIAGHGCATNSGSVFVELPETDHKWLHITAYRISDLIEAALGSRARHVLVIVNTCYAGAANVDLAKLAQELNPDRGESPTLTVLATTSTHSTVGVRELSTLLKRVHEQLRTTAGIQGKYLSVTEFLQELHRATNSKSTQPLTAPKPLFAPDGSNSRQVCLPNPGYLPPDRLVAPQRVQVAATRSEMDYWISRAGGRTGRADPGWYFSGRQPLTRELAAFLRDGPPPGHSPSLIVTGTAGSGKSAIIARAVTLSDPDFLADPAHAPAYADSPEDTIPPPGSVDVAVLAHQRDAETILALLLEGIHAVAPAPRPDEASVSTLRRALLTALRGRGAADRRPRTFVLDGLDEADDPYRVISEVVAPLAQAGSSAPHLVIGVRSQRVLLAADPSQEAEQQTALYQHLVQVLTTKSGLTGTGHPPTSLRTDGPEAAQDVHAYVQALLADVSDEKFGSAETARIITERIPEISFLDARLAASQVRDADSPAELIADPRWLSSLDYGLVGLLRQDLRTLQAPPLPAETAVGLLRAAALAQGVGIPWGPIWPAVAEAVLDRPLADVDTAISALFNSRLIGYLAEDTEDGRVVHRLAHERLAEVLRDEPHRLHIADQEVLPAPSPQVSEAPPDVHRRIATSLAPLADTGSDLAPHPYVRRHLARHADLGGALDDMHLPLAFLPWDTSKGLRGRLGLPIVPGDGQYILAAWARIEPFLRDADHGTRVASLQFALAVCQDPLTALTGNSVVQPRFSRWHTPGNVVATTKGRVHCLTAFPGPSGGILLATGSDDGTVQLWDPLNGTTVGEPWRAHNSPVTAVTPYTAPDSRTLLATGSRDGMVQLWDPLNHTAVGRPRRNLGSVSAATAFTTPKHGTLLAVGSNDGKVRLWDPLRRTAVSKTWRGRGSVKAVTAFTEPNHRPLLAVVHGRKVSVWDPLTRTAVDKTWHDGRGSVRAVTAFTEPNHRPLLATGENNGAVQVRDPLNGATIGEPWRAHDGPVSAVTAFTTPDNRTLLATSSHDRTIRLWEPLNRTVDKFRRAHDGPVSAVTAFTTTDHGTLLATGGFDGTVQLWDPLNGTAFGEPWRSVSPVSAMTAFTTADHGTLLATSSSFDGKVRLWDPLNGTAFGEPWRSVSPVSAVTAFTTADHGTLLATGSSDGTVQLWDLKRTPLGKPWHSGRSVLALTAFTGNRTLLAAGSRDGTVQLWDWLDRAIVSKPWRAHDGPVLALTAFTTPDDRTLFATGSHDRTIRVWESASQLLQITTTSSVHALDAVQEAASHSQGLAIGGAEGLALVDINLTKL